MTAYLLLNHPAPNIDSLVHASLTLPESVSDISKPQIIISGSTLLTPLLGFRDLG